jgi:hypothetical protein
MIAKLYIATVFLASIFYLGIYRPYRRERDGHWHPLPNGRMRRMSKTGWQVRKMTAEELAERHDDYEARQY